MVAVTLKRPITHEGKTIEKIEVDEPTVGAIEAGEKALRAGGSEMSALVAILAVDNELPVEAVRKIRRSDIEEIAKAFAPFAGIALAGGNGEASSPTSPES